MKLSTAIVAAIAFLQSVLAYQVNPDRKWTQKTVIDKSINGKSSVRPVKAGTALRSATGALSWPKSSPAASAAEESGGCSGLFPSNPPNYWFNGRIHCFGNTGLFGGLHAAIATLATKIIDVAAYDGKNIRDHVCEGLSPAVRKNPRIVDLCCGVGISSRALQRSFPDAESIIAVDTSPEMISMAKMLSSEPLLKKLARTTLRKIVRGETSARRSPTYEVANAEQTPLSSGSADLVTIMYGFHEIPHAGRGRILCEARRLLAPGGTLAIVDISSDYEPSPTMLAGEPYVLEYQQNMDRQLRATSGFQDLQSKAVIPKHVTVWLLRKSGENGYQWTQQVPTSTILATMGGSV